MEKMLFNELEKKLNNNTISKKELELLEEAELLRAISKERHEMSRSDKYIEKNYII